MLIETSDYIHRVNGIPLFYGQLYHPYASPPYDSLMTSKIIPPESISPIPITLTPPLSPNNLNLIQTHGDQSRRGSVIMKVENCQILPANETQPNLICIDHVCRWENCYKFFDTLEKLANHVSIMHSSVAPDNLYYCKWEGCARTERGFNARYKMLVHCRTHTKEKPHFCTFPQCKKSFSRAENLKIHIRSHTLERPYKCNFPGCTKAYSNSSDRFKHSRTHQNTKPYCCKIKGCEKRYTDPSSLRKHIKTFNHESLIQQFEQAITIDCNDKVNQQNIDTIYYDDHQSSGDADVFYFNDNSSDIAMKIDTINLNEPLDLSIRHKR